MPGPQVGLRERAGRAAFSLLGPRRFHALIGLARTIRVAKPSPRDIVAMADVVARFHVLAYHDGALDDTHWFGVPIQKSPLDCWVYQEILYEQRPDLIVETGTYLGGSATFFAHLCDLLGHGKVITIDRQRRGALRHPRVTQLLGDSTSSEILAEVERATRGTARVMVVLDSDHGAEHVLAELRAYAGFVTPGSYLVVEDTNVNGHPVMPDHGPGPFEAVQEFLRSEAAFVADRSREKFLLTYFPGGWLRRSDDR